MIRTTVLSAAVFAVLATVLAAPASASDYAARNAKKWEHLHLEAYKAGNSAIFAYPDAEECRTIRVKAWDDYAGRYFWTKKVVC
jgi:hypothetical protein